LLERLVGERFRPFSVPLQRRSVTSDAVLAIEGLAARRLLFGVDAVPHRLVLRTSRQCRRRDRGERHDQGSESSHLAVASRGRLYAMYSPEYGPPLTATTMYWRPPSM